MADANDEAAKVQAAREDGVHVLTYLQTLSRAYPGRVEPGLLAFLEAANGCAFSGEVLAREMVKAAQTPHLQAKAV